ncbi:MAG: heavy metal translocating P-type ATPase [Deltaproteobacteria bacterium]|nr:heavy metal translocating P-type ATPase [Deltaproteobacteria bacterium]
MKTEKINVYGMTCEHCVKTVTKAIYAINGVQSANVSLKDKYADVVYDENIVNIKDIVNAIDEAGYSTINQEINLEQNIKEQNIKEQNIKEQNIKEQNIKEQNIKEQNIKEQNIKEQNINSDMKKGSAKNLQTELNLNLISDLNVNTNKESPSELKPESESNFTFNDSNNLNDIKHFKFKISKMDCVSCAGTIVDTVKRIGGVIDAKLNFINETLYVDALFDKPKPDEIIKMIEFAGFGAKLLTDNSDSGSSLNLSANIHKNDQLNNNSNNNDVVFNNNNNNNNNYNDNNKIEKNNFNENIKEDLRFKIQGMHCTNCARTVEKSINKLHGIDKVSINFAGESGFVTYNPSVVSKENIFKAVKDGGYTAVNLSNNNGNANNESIRNNGFNLIIDKKNIKNSINIINDGFQQKTLDNFQETLNNLQGYKKLKFICNFLYSAFFGSIPDWKKDYYWVIYTLVLAIPVVFITYMGYINIFGISYFYKAHTIALTIVLFLLATIVQFSAGLTFYKGAYYSLKNGSSNMDVLVSLGITAAYFYSVASVFLIKGSLYFDMAVLLILFIRFGKLLEKISKEKAASSLKSLFKLQANKANLIDNDGNIKEIDVKNVKVNDTLLVKKGEKIPVDGEILKGKTLIDESMISGEPIPVEKKAGDKVIGSTINSGDIIKIKALKVGGDTILSQIVRLVEDAQADKAPIQRIADEVTNYFVPVVIIISLITFISWKFVFNESLLFALSASIAVLVIACPCAMGLATPMALMVGSAVGLEKGILIKRSSALEELARINAVVFDKTGTVTYGKPEVTDVIPLNGYLKEDILSIAAFGEKFSSHPIAKAIVEEYEKVVKTDAKNIYDFNQLNNINDFIKNYNYKEIGGYGLSFIHNGNNILIGKKELFENADKYTAAIDNPENNIAVSKINKTADDINNDDINNKIGLITINNQSINETANGANPANIDIYSLKTLEEKLSADGKTVIGVSLNSKIIGIIAISDKVKENTKETVEKLKMISVDSYLLTGDNLKSAEFIASKVGINAKNVIANVLPKDKLKEIEKLKNKNLKVAMTGDGINDAPALAEANVGIAIGSGTDVARETGDVILVKSDIKDVYKSISLGRKTLNKIKQNLFWAFFFNILGIPFAAGLFYHFTGWLLPPVIAGAAMAISSITVSLNSMLLRRYSKKMDLL